MRTLVVLLVIAAATSLGYGYWHRSTFATFHLSLRDVSEQARGGAVLDAQLTFLDADSRPLARGKTDGKWGVVLVRHPSAGYCDSDLAPDEYRACFWTQSEWLMTWLEKLRYVSIAIGHCRIERVPIELSLSRDSLLTWWIPLPHVGGVPFTSYSDQLELDSRVCAVTGRRG